MGVCGTLFLHTTHGLQTFIIIWDMVEKQLGCASQVSSGWSMVTWGLD